MRYRFLFAIAVALVVWQLLLPPVKGVADNGDWGKILWHYGIGCNVSYESICARLVYAPQYLFGSGFRSTEHLFVAAALGIASWTTRDGSLDLRVMGAVHAAFYLLALGLILRSLRSAAAVLAVILFCDFLYLGYLNSFFMDAAALICICLSVAFYVRRLQSGRAFDTAALFVCMFGATCSKPQYGLMGLWFGVLFWAARRALVKDWRRALAASLALFAAAGVCVARFAPPVYAKKGPFTVFFSEILPNSPDPARTLADFGMAPSDGQWIGHNAYDIGMNTDRPEFYAQFAGLSYPRILRYYLEHPSALWRALTRSLGEAGEFHAPGGNFAAADRPPRTQYDGLDWSSKLKRALFFHHGGRFFAAFVALCALFLSLTMKLRRKLPQGSVEGAVVLVALAWTVLAISTLGDVLEPLRHSLVFLAIFDMLAVGSVALLATAFAGGSRRPR